MEKTPLDDVGTEETTIALLYRVLILSNNNQLPLPY
jgi:hypothetical protein